MRLLAFFRYAGCWPCGAMLWLKLTLVVLLLSAVGISGGLSYSLGALFRTRARSGCCVTPSSRAGHSAELRALWGAFDAATRVMSADFQSVLALKARDLRVPRAPSLLLTQRRAGRLRRARSEVHLKPPCSGER